MPRPSAPALQDRLYHQEIVHAARNLLPTCPVCARRASKPIFRGATKHDYQTARCGQCRFVFTIPRPTVEQLDNFYRGGYWSSSDSRYGYAEMELAENWAREMWPDARRFLTGVIPEVGALLDIGCGSGGFLAAARSSGWSVEGTDLSPQAAERATALHGLAVKVGQLLPSQASRRYDLVTMWHVLEHVIEPREVLLSSRELLTSSGVLLIELPNWKSVGRHVRGVRWKQLKPPEHINFFSPRSLRGALTICGYRVVRLETSYRYAELAAGRLPAALRRPATRGVAWLCRAGFGGYLRIAAVPS